MAFHCLMDCIRGTSLPPSSFIHHYLLHRHSNSLQPSLPLHSSQSSPSTPWLARCSPFWPPWLARCFPFSHGQDETPTPLIRPPKRCHRTRCAVTSVNCVVPRVVDEGEKSTNRFFSKKKKRNPHTDTPIRPHTRAPTHPYGRPNIHPREHGHTHTDTTTHPHTRPRPHARGRPQP